MLSGWDGEDALATNLATVYARDGRCVLLTNADPQGNVPQLASQRTRSGHIQEDAVCTKTQVRRVEASRRLQNAAY